MSAVLDNQAGTFLGGQAAKVGKPLLGHKNLRIVFRMVHMAHVRDNARYGTALGHRRREEEPEGAMACKIGGSANAVHHRRTAHEAAVHIAEDVGFERRIHGDDADTADQVGAVAHLLLAEHKMLFPLGGVLYELALGGFRQSKRRTACHAELALLQEREHGFLDDFGKQVYLTEAVVARHGAKHRVRDLAHTALESHPLREPAMRFLEADKIEDAFADVF